jgi:hypothetical protein
MTPNNFYSNIYSNFSKTYWEGCNSEALRYDPPLLKTGYTWPSGCDSVNHIRDTNFLLYA